MLHTVHWPSNITYRELILIHSRSVRNMFGQCEVVFDGYTTNSVKDHEHLRRSSKVKCKEVQFLDEMKVIHKREDFLSNSKNKTLLISRLAQQLIEEGQEVTLAQSDADTIIVSSAVQVLFIN